jgi:hypothetical protein
MAWHGCCLYGVRRSGRLPTMRFVLILILVTVALTYWYWHHSKSQEKKTKLFRAQARERNRFHCVAIRPRGKACDLAKQHEGIRYLSAEAPRLPLEGCTEPNCACRYMHFSDRRIEDRRLHIGPVSLPGSVTTERRRRVDRRKSTSPAFKPRIVA